MSTRETAQQPYTATFVICEQDGKIPLVLRENTAWMNNHWDLPSGKVEPKERFKHAAKRELEEEIGLMVEEKDLSHVTTMHRYSPDDDTYWIDIYFFAEKWSGEAQNAEGHMHAEMQWFSADNLPENTVPGLREAIGAWRSGETYVEQGWSSSE